MVWKCRKCGKPLGVVLAGLLLVKCNTGELLLNDGSIRCGCGKQQRFVARRGMGKEKANVEDRYSARLDSLIELG